MSPRMLGSLEALERLIEAAPDATVAEVLAALLVCAERPLRCAAMDRLTAAVPLSTLLDALDEMDATDPPYGDA